MLGTVLIRGHSEFCPGHDAELISRGKDSVSRGLVACDVACAIRMASRRTKPLWREGEIELSGHAVKRMISAASTSFAERAASVTFQRMKPEASEASQKLWKPHPDDEAHVRAACEAVDHGELLSAEDSEAFVRWLEAGGTGPCPGESA